MSAPKQSSNSVTTVRNEVSPEQSEIMRNAMTQYMPNGTFAQRPQFDPTDPDLMQQGDNRVAPFSADTNAAFQSVRNRAFSHDQPMAQAQSWAAGGAQNPSGQFAGYGNGWSVAPSGQANFGNWNSQTAQQYMNPYTDNVIGTGMAELERAHNVAQLGINDQAQKAGAFGGSRHGVQGAETTRGFADMGQKFLSDTLNQGYKQARTEYDTSFTQGLQTLGYNKSVMDKRADNLFKGAEANNELMRTNNDLNASSANAIAGIGAQQQQQEQNRRDAAYSNQMDEFLFGAQLAQILGGIAPPPTTTQSSVASGGGSGGSLWGTVGMSAGASLLPKLLGGLFASDERIKDVKRKTGDKDRSSATADIRAMLDSGGIEYDYKEGYGQPEGTRKGFTAQAAEKSGVRTEDVAGVKHVDMQSLLEKLTYAVADIDKRLEEISGRRAA